MSTKDGKFKPLNEMTRQEFDERMAIGYSQAVNNEVRPAEKVFEESLKELIREGLEEALAFERGDPEIVVKTVIRRMKGTRKNPGQESTDEEPRKPEDAE